MRKVRARIADVVDVKEPRTGNMRGLIFCVPAAAFGGHEHGAVENTQVWVLEMGRQPIGGNKRFRIVHGHLPPGSNDFCLQSEGQKGKTAHHKRGYLRNRRAMAPMAQSVMLPLVAATAASRIR